MWLMYVLQAPGGAGQAVLVVDDDCLPVFFGPDVQDAVTWLAAVGEAQVGVVNGAGTELYEIVKREPARMPPQVLARPRALLVPSAEADLPIRDAGDAIAAVNRYRNRRLGPVRRRHRRTEGPYELAPA